MRAKTSNPCISCRNLPHPWFKSQTPSTSHASRAASAESIIHVIQFHQRPRLPMHS